MGKVRPRYEDDVAVGLAQWMGRKLKNHDPLSELGNAGRGGAKHLHRKYRTVKDGAPEPGVVYCGIVKSLPTSVRYGLEDGRAFQITVREVEPEEAPVELVAVGG